MKVLILSAEVWKDGSNGGNVLSNLFENFDGEFAQIYCNPGMPDNQICSRYYQMTDSMMIRYFLHRTPVGNEFFLHPEEKQEQADTENAPVMPDRKWYQFFHNHRLNIFYTIRDFLWNWSDWKNESLRKFLDEFQPDIIFAPCYGNSFLLKLTRYVGQYTGKKIISYISDDSYTLKQFSLSPFYWIDRFCVRRQLRKTFPCYSLVYTMTDLQLQQCRRDFGANMKILRKSASFGTPVRKTEVNPVIQMVYAGGIYLNRWKSLGRIAAEIRKLNENGLKLQLHIYTGNEITDSMRKALDDGRNSFLHGPVSQEKLAEIYHSSDVAIHTESFDLQNRLAVRMSFSTKIVDCLSSGCAVLAYCDEAQGGLQYLREEDAAFCASSPEKLAELLSGISREPEQILVYAEKARQCCIRNHDAAETRAMIRRDFEKVLNLPERDIEHLSEEIQNESCTDQCGI